MRAGIPEKRKSALNRRFSHFCSLLSKEKAATAKRSRSKRSRSKTGLVTMFLQGVDATNRARKIMTMSTRRERIHASRIVQWLITSPREAQENRCHPGVLQKYQERADGCAWI